MKRTQFSSPLTPKLSSQCNLLSLSETSNHYRQFSPVSIDSGLSYMAKVSFLRCYICHILDFYMYLGIFPDFLSCIILALSSQMSRRTVSIPQLQLFLTALPSKHFLHSSFPFKVQEGSLCFFVCLFVLVFFKVIFSKALVRYYLQIDLEKINFFLINLLSKNIVCFSISLSHMCPSREVFFIIDLLCLR